MQKYVCKSSHFVRSGRILTINLLGAVESHAVRIKNMRRRCVGWRFWLPLHSPFSYSYSLS
jgi:hypothetical protein